jgi:hypothetical protein
MVTVPSSPGYIESRTVKYDIRDPRSLLRALRNQMDALLARAPSRDCSTGVSLLRISTEQAQAWLRFNLDPALAISASAATAVLWPLQHSLGHFHPTIDPSRRRRSSRTGQSRTLRGTARQSPVPTGGEKAGYT